jgi:arylsulfatase A-like enzyme
LGWHYATENPNRPDSWVYLAVRSGDWKGVADEKRERIELFNIADDQFEKYNLAPDESEKVNELLAMWDQWKSELPE